LLLGFSVTGTVGWGTANLVESALAAWLFVTLAGRRPTGRSQRDFVALAAAAFAAPAVGAVAGAATTWHLYGASFTHSWFTWWIGDATGILLIAPLVLAFAERERLSRARTRMYAETALVVVAATAAFALAPGPVLFLALAPLIVVPIRHDLRAAALACVSFAIVAVVLTGRGVGPIADVAETVDRVVLLDAFVATTAFVCFLISATIGDLRRAKDARADSEQRLALALEGADMVAWEADLGARRVWRSDHGDVPAAHGGGSALDGVVDRVAPQDRDRLHAALDDARRTGRILAECRIDDDGGRSRWVRVSGAVTRRDGDEPVRLTGTTLDITDEVEAADARAQLELQLRQSQKMETVGQLAGGIAHEFNNLLTVICGYTGFALKRVGDRDEKLREGLAAVAQSGEKAAELTRQLLAFSRRQMIRPVVFDLNDAVADASSLLARLLDAPVTLRHTVAADACNVFADRSQIEQVIMNLAINARDAMPDGGSIVVTTSTVEVGPDRAASLGGDPGRYHALTVTDTGRGMDEETRERIFEPFFTTKRVGEGTGLGLATAFGIVRQSDGLIDVRSVPGAGTTFEVLLPIAPVETWHAEAEADSDDAAAEPVSVLLVEDDDVVRAFVCELLETRACDVVEAADGEDGWSRFDADRFDLVVTDVVMPKLNGKELVARIRAGHPAFPVVFMSGYAVGDTGEFPMEAPFVAKPFGEAELFRAVDEALAARPVASAPASA
jgi:signal transduction histidine kinase